MYKISDAVKESVDLLTAPQSCALRTIVQERADLHPYLQSNMFLKADDAVIQSWPEKCPVISRAGALQVDGCVVVITLNRFPEPHPLLFENYWNYWASSEYQQMFDDMSVQDSIRFVLFGADSKDVLRVVETPNALKDFFKRAMNIMPNQKEWSFDEFNAAKDKILRTYSLQALWNKFAEGETEAGGIFYG